jgi:hypothetical protein
MVKSFKPGKGIFIVRLDLQDRLVAILRTSFQSFRYIELGYPPQGFHVIRINGKDLFVDGDRPQV